MITDAEIDALLKAAVVDLDAYHRLMEEAVAKRVTNPYEGFANMLKCYLHTGARTGELRKVRVGDFLRRTRQVVLGPAKKQLSYIPSPHPALSPKGRGDIRQLFFRRSLGKHKTSKTQRVQQLRHIPLNDEGMEIFERFCAGKKKDDPIFTTSDGKLWTRNALYERFNRIKEIAVEKDYEIIRNQITIYDFRHLWISEALMAGNDVATVARMAGTSIAMIERTYGHFRNEHLHEAQSKLDQYRANRRNGNA